MASGGKKREKELNARVDNSINAVKEKSPFEDMLNAKAQKFLNWENRTGEYAGHARDITEAPGMSDYLDIYGNAKSAAQQERMGSGAIRLGNPADSAYSKQIEQQHEFDMHDRRAEGLTSGLQALKAQNYGIMGQSIDRDLNRNLSVAGLELTNRKDYWNRPRQPAWYAQLLGGASTAAQGAGALGWTPLAGKGL